MMALFGTESAGVDTLLAPLVIGTGSGKLVSDVRAPRIMEKMIVGSGIDLAEIQRIQHAVDRYGARFLDKVYTAGEQKYCLSKRNAAESLAARFAAKEAGAKALGTGMSRGVTWLEIEVVREPGGRPTLRFSGRAAEMARRLKVQHAALSITHTKDLAMASVILESDVYGKGV